MARLGLEPSGPVSRSGRPYIGIVMIKMYLIIMKLVPKFIIESVIGELVD